jgi:hypothetical protein
VLPLGDALLASAWAEMHLTQQQEQRHQPRQPNGWQPSEGVRNEAAAAARRDAASSRGVGWGVGLYTQPSAKELEIGVVLGQQLGTGDR